MLKKTYRICKRLNLKHGKNVVGKYYIEDALVNPTLAIPMTDNWILFNLRYIVDYKKRRMTQHLLNDGIHKKIKATNGAVQLASTTVEVIRIPEIKIEGTSKQEE